MLAFAFLLALQGAPQDTTPKTAPFPGAHDSTADTTRASRVHRLESVQVTAVRGGAPAISAKTLTAAGGLTMLLAGRTRPGATAAGGLLLAGSACERFAIFRAGFASADDPRYTIVPQRRRLQERAAEQS